MWYAFSRLCERAWESKAPHIPATKVQERSRNITPLILTLGTRWMSAVNFTFRPFYPRERTRHPLNRRLGKSLSWSACFFRRETCLALLHGRLYWRTFVPLPLNRVHVKSKHILCHFNKYQLYKGYPATCTMEFFIIISRLSPKCTGKILWIFSCCVQHHIFKYSSYGFRMMERLIWCNLRNFEQFRVMSDLNDWGRGGRYVDAEFM
jgi:hypothetical protein